MTPAVNLGSYLSILLNSLSISLRGDGALVIVGGSGGSFVHLSSHVIRAGPQGGLILQAGHLTVLSCVLGESFLVVPIAFPVHS